MATSPARSSPSAPQAPSSAPRARRSSRRRRSPPTACRTGRILTSLSFRLPPAGAWRFRKAARRALNSASIVTVAAVVVEDGGVVSTARVALSGATRRPKRSPATEAALIGRALNHATAEAAGRAALADAEPFDDEYASAWYRARVLPVHVRRALIGE